MKQSLQVIEFWNKERSHPVLELAGNQCKRSESFEFFPSAVALCSSWTCLANFQIQYRTNTLSDFSIGLIALQEYEYDFNLTDCIGRMPKSWGLCQHGYDNSAFYSNELMMKNTSSIQNNDVISIYIDLNNGDNQGKAYFMINKKIVFIVKELDCSQQYAVACTMSPYSTLTILENYVIHDDINDLIRDAEVDKISEDEDRLVSQPLLTVYASKIVEARDNEISSVIKCSEQCRNVTPELQLSGETTLAESKSQGDTTSMSSSNTTKEATDNDSTIPVPSFFPNKPLIALKPQEKDNPTNAKEDGGQTMECCICLSNPKTILFMPCKHLCACESCGSDDKKSGLSHCPICRMKIKSRIKVYM